MTDAQLLVYLGFLAFALFGFACGRIAGYRAGHKKGVALGRRVGDYWATARMSDPHID